ncbi:MAG: DUF4291 domain-containing protein [Deltaproteobacteria bacterium]|nr:DUF4291 domain-containing protein [Deltaproteobacteria bacterium]
MSDSLRQVRADYDRDAVVIYQAYDDRIADAALAQGRFVGPHFSFSRMTWIKPSFLWLMHRSHWGTSRGQTRTLAVRLRRAGFDHALSVAVSTDPTARLYDSYPAWRAAFEAAPVHVQWDTERALSGSALAHYSIQVGLSRHVIRTFVDEWIVSISDLTDRVSKMRAFVQGGRTDRARALLPPERLYPVEDAVTRRWS